MTRVGWIASFVFAGLLVSKSARGEIYKFVKPDGTIVYTDNLAQLPSERRAHYNKLLEEADRRRRELESQIGKEELKKREMEAERGELLRKQAASRERARRLQAIDKELLAIREKRQAQEASKASWQKRVKDEKEKLEKLLKEFNETQETYRGLATKASFTLLPGQQEQMEAARVRLEELEREIDSSVELLSVTIPEEARKAGIPPGWLR